MHGCFIHIIQIQQLSPSPQLPPSRHVTLSDFRWRAPFPQVCRQIHLAVLFIRCFSSFFTRFPTPFYSFPSNKHTCVSARQNAHISHIASSWLTSSDGGPRRYQSGTDAVLGNPGARILYRIISSGMDRNDGFIIVPCWVSVVCSNRPSTAG